MDVYACCMDEYTSLNVKLGEIVKIQTNWDGYFTIYKIIDNKLKAIKKFSKDSEDIIDSKKELHKEFKIIKSNPFNSKLGITLYRYKKNKIIKTIEYIPYILDTNILLYLNKEIFKYIYIIKSKEFLAQKYVFIKENIKNIGKIYSKMKLDSEHFYKELDTIQKNFEKLYKEYLDFKKNKIKFILEDYNSFINEYKEKE